MPIYEYQCAKCGHQIEVLQKVSDEPLRRCEACGEDALSKLISATNFQLKGSGWYKAAPTDNSGGQEGSKEASAKTSVGDDAGGTSAAKGSSDSPVSDAKSAESKDVVGGSGHGVKNAGENKATSKASSPINGSSISKPKKDE